MRENEDNSLAFVQMWGEAVLWFVADVRRARVDYSEWGRRFDREDTRENEEEFQKRWRALWVVEQTLVWAAHQLECWSRRLAEERGEDPPLQDETLARVRNVLEHLYQADFVGGAAVPGTKRNNRSLKRLPDGRLMVALGGSDSFGLIAPVELERRALEIVRRVEHELERDYDAWFLESDNDDPSVEG